MAPRRRGCARARRRRRDRARRRPRRWWWRPRRGRTTRSPRAPPCARSGAPAGGRRAGARPPAPRRGCRWRACRGRPTSRPRAGRGRRAAHEVDGLGRAAAGRLEAREHDDVPEGGRERDERLAPVQQPAALHGHGGGFGHAAARGAAQALLRGGGVDEAALRHGAAAHLVEPGAGPAGRFALRADADEVHVEGQRGGPVARGQRLLHAQEAGERQLRAAVRARRREREEARLAQVGEVSRGGNRPRGRGRGRVRRSARPGRRRARASPVRPWRAV